jgi:NAD(P)-dependent dehydrogenase (short-subunit alcohol dehydrogenase family)
MKIPDAVAFVTGANRGLGAAFVRALRDAGVRKVYAAARDPACVDLPGAHAVRLDVTRPAEVMAAARDFGDVSLLINNAGISLNQRLLDGQRSLDALRAEMDVNVYGPLALAQAFAPHLAKHGGGAIVNVLSALSWVSLQGSGTYSASKAAAWSMTNGLRHELSAQRTRVLALHVAFMDTDMAAKVHGPKTHPDAVARQVLAALGAGQDEVLADDVTRHVKQGLSSGVYLRPPAA